VRSRSRTEPTSCMPRPHQPSPRLAMQVADLHSSPAEAVKETESNGWKREAAPKQVWRGGALEGCGGWAPAGCVRAAHSLDGEGRCARLGEAPAGCGRAAPEQDVERRRWRAGCAGAVRSRDAEGRHPSSMAAPAGCGGATSAGCGGAAPVGGLDVTAARHRLLPWPWPSPHSLACRFF
jgi:hypothetical protein